MDLEWPSFFERRQDAIHEKYAAQDDALHEKKIKAAEMAYEMDFYRQKFYETGAQIKDVLTNTDFFQELIIRYGADKFWKALNDFDNHLIAKCLELHGIVPPKPICIAETTIYPPEDTTAIEEPEKPEESELSEESTLNEVPEESELNEVSEESELNEVLVSQTENLAPAPPTPDSQHPSPSPVGAGFMPARNISNPHLPASCSIRKANKVQTSNLKSQSRLPFYLGALNRCHR